MKHTEEEKIVNEENTEEKTEEKPKKVLQEKPNEKPTQEEKSVRILQDNTNSEVTDYGVISNLNAILKVENLHIEEERKKGNNANVASQRNLFEEISKTEKR